jgi:serine/threonine-protein kinase
MEYVEGCTLADELEGARALDPARVVDLGVQVCAGLEHAHAAGLVHRDIKPGNLLLGAGDTVKIADFGIARAAETTRLTQMGSVLGTAAYLSPEQALGEEVTAAADIYSLGCVLYECLTGRTPYVFDTLAELAVKHREEPITPVREVRPEIPEEIEAVVMRSLARNPEYRPPSAAALGQELAGETTDDVTRPLPQASGVRASDVRTEPLRRPVRTDRKGPAFDRRIVVVGALVVVLVVAAIVIGVAGRSAGNDNGSSDNPAPAQVEPPQQTGDPSTDAQNLADWLRANSG